MRFPRIVGVVALLTIVGVACSGIDDPEDAFGPDELVDALEARGAAVSIQRWPYGPSLDGVTGDVQLLCIDGRAAQLAEYPTTRERRADADEAPPDPEAEIDLYWGAIGWWARGRVLVSLGHLPGREDAVVDTLTDVLGPTLGSTGFVIGGVEAPDTYPLSEFCT